MDRTNRARLFLQDRNDCGERTPVGIDAEVLAEDWAGGRGGLGS